MYRYCVRYDGGVNNNAPYDSCWLGSRKGDTMNIFRWLRKRFSHKLKHVSLASIKNTFREHGLALVIIIVVWEIIEDVLFPILFVFLGTHVHPAFLVGVPASLLLCLHWLAVPLLWSAWIRLRGESNESG